MNKLTMAGVISAIAMTTACSTSSDSDDTTDSGSSGGGTTVALTGEVALPEQMSLVSAQDEATANSLGSRALHDTSGYAATSDYTKSRQNVYVFLDAVEPISFIDSLLCFTNQSQPLLEVGEGDYVTWNDASRCFDENGSEGEDQGQGDGGNQVQQFVTFAVNSSQASATDPLIFKGWVEDYAGQSGEGNGPNAIRLLGEVRKTPTDDNPFGDFTLTYGLLPTINDVEANNEGFGEVISTETTGGGASFTLYQQDSFEEQGQVVNCTTSASVDYNEATESGLARTGQNCSFAATGELTDYNNGTYALAVNPTHVHMANATTYDELTAGTFQNDVCLARDEFNEVVWNYTLFNKADGSAVAINSGMQLKVDTDSNTANGYEGWAHIGYWGSWREDGQDFTDGETVQEATYDDTVGATFTVKVAPGRLVKNTVDSLNLSDLDGVTFSTWMFEGDTYLLTAATDINGDSDTTDFFEVILEKNSTNDGFEITGTREFTENGPTVTAVSPAVAVNLNTNLVLNMWSNQLGGDVRYLAGASKVRFFSRSFVNGSETGTGELFAGGATSTLKCFDRCLDVNIAATDVNGSAQQEDVFVSDSFSTAQDYSFAQTDLTLKIGADSVTFADGVTQANLNESNSWQWGVNSGPMITSTAATAASVSSASTLYQAIESGTITEFYVWETGLNDWQKQTVLIDSSNAVVSFDAPITIKYTHETANDRNADATQDGMVYLLEYGGKGQLWGLPFVQAGDNWHPVISLKDATIMGSSDQYVIKANDVEQKMQVVTDGSCDELPLTAPTQSIPTGITGEVFDTGDMPDIDDIPPSYIDGEAVEDEA